MQYRSAQPFVSVIGGLNIDLQGSSVNPLVFNDSNPGEIVMSAGGVGRNIAENISKLNIHSKILSYVGNDALGDFVVNKSSLSGVDTSFIKKHSHLPTSQYLSVLDDNNDMLVSISDMRIIEEMTIQDIDKWNLTIEQSSAIVVDTNIPIPVIEYLTDKYSNIPLFLDPVSFAKTSKILKLIGRFHTVKPNRLETELISGVKITDNESMLKAAKIIFDMGCKQIFITLGEDGVFYYDGENFGQYLHKGVNMISANGAGDAFTAGVVYGFLKLNGIKETAEFASAAAVIALRSANTISDDLSEERVKLLLKEETA
ncbi:carbohydrate kinase family protein [Pseudothioglobus sp. nBUS_23]|jgi:pseudouridine kinase|uniref:carbohydrate kinase family protein n=1 Tax=Pseudothioglobus sp. nBUS_23 TaxID=3395318 RepID=UPI003EBC08EA